MTHADAGVPAKCRPLRRYDRAAAQRVFVPLLHDPVRALPAHGLMLLGNAVVQALLGVDATVKALRGKPLRWAGLPAFASYHPLAARRRPNLFPYLVADLDQARQQFLVTHPAR